jgi:sugar/nucleoside kinase (ribokinase family)
MKEYDLFSFGNISVDYIKTPASETQMTGGAVLYAVWVGHQLGHKVGLLTKTSKAEKHRLGEIPIPNEDVFWIESRETTSIYNDYQTADMERRICTNRGQADLYQISDFPDFSAKLIQYSGLLTGEIDLDIIKFLSKKGRLAIDVQGLTRMVMPNKLMEFQQWKDMEESMPFIHFFKADAAEAQFLTGIDTSTSYGRIRAGEQFVEMGCQEAVISHNQELIVVYKGTHVSAPFKNRNLSGRTGRGDTCFTTYITERMMKSPKKAVLFAAALTSMKMEQPGFFKKTREDVEAYIREFY